MEDKEKLDAYLDQVDELDEEILEKLEKRLALMKDIAITRKKLGYRITDPERARRKIDEITEKSDDELEVYGRQFYSSISDFTADYQRKYTEGETDLVKRIKEARENTPKLFPEKARVACQGVMGAYSQEACEGIFKRPLITYFRSFDDVFEAIQSGECDYGILPLENSTAGSVNRVYDLMTKHDFHIVRSIKVKVDHNLFVKPGTKLEDIREIYSHEQALMQCSGYLEKFKNVELKKYVNTAGAAKMVANSDRNDVAAIASYECGRIYGLECLDEAIQDSGLNYTMFICIGRDLQIFPGAYKSSMMLTTPHKPGALYNILALFYALGINIVKLESRPIPDRDFDFMFYFDIDSDVWSDSFIRLMNTIQSVSDDFRYLGSYIEKA
ncbi:MAG: prephenate dehydratase domain-containing protein [Eubacteriales bacterium]|nr:prephenate dehydratase domain-containing protein [Eubacteriales bacterium]